MATPYNRNFTPYKSTALQGLDCQVGTGPVLHAGATEDFRQYSAVFTAAEAIEAGECIGMIRVPRGLTVTDVALFFTPNVGATIGVGDPFCCGRFLGPIETSMGSGFSCSSSFTCVGNTRLQKIGRVGDGCGYGYTYTCETDLIVTNGYGDNTFAQGGGSASSAVMGGGNQGPLARGTVIGLKVEGYVNPEFTNG